MNEQIEKKVQQSTREQLQDWLSYLDAMLRDFDGDGLEERMNMREVKKLIEQTLKEKYES
jgi:hypothetical protein